jgi:restriction endonuclease S subunit
MSIRDVRVGDILKLERRPVVVESGKTYREIGVRSFGRGLFEKEPTSAEDLGSKRVFHVHPGDLVISNIFAWEGAVAVADARHEGTIGSHRFMTWVPFASGADIQYLRHYFASDPGLGRLGSASPGSAGRNRTLSIKNFENIVIPLPDLDEQRRIATHLDDVSEHVRRLREKWAREGDDIDALLEARSTADLVPLGELVKQVRRPIPVEPDVTYSMLGMRWNGGGLFVRNVISGEHISAKQVYEVKPGDLVYNRLFAWKRSFGLATSEIAGGTVSNEFPTFVVDADRVAPRYLLSQLLGRDFTDAVNGASTGSTPTSRNRLKEQEFLRLEVPVPSMSRQGQAVAYLTALDKVARLRQGARLIINALLPAARNEIFSAMV